MVTTQDTTITVIDVVVITGDGAVGSLRVSATATIGTDIPTNVVTDVAASSARVDQYLGFINNSFGFIMAHYWASIAVSA